ncbi:HD domain-containing protein [Botrimarina colliarenosi]|uniref:HD domain-containing protein n=1 Tax=Botrimarina colliarenosi TaxID=2528001 RepID=UPI0011B75E38|nr:HD domain-containing protein [Botrimarina colliarenosi]
MPVLVLTASDDAKTRRRSLELGATDFLSKPVHPDELIQRVRNALALRFHQRELAQYANRLELLVRVRTEQLLVAQREVIHCLARASEYRDHETGRHVLRVGRYSGIIARQLAKGEAYAEALELAATLHDVGKIAVPDTILLKAGGGSTKTSSSGSSGTAGLAAACATPSAPTRRPPSERTPTPARRSSRPPLHR